MLRRRDFLGLLASAVAARPLPVLAQHPTKAVVGFIHAAAPVYFDAFRNAFLAGLKEAGYVEQDNLSIEWRWAEGHYERLPALIADLLQRNVNVLFAAGGTDPARVAKAATQTTPIVFVSAADPVATGLVTSLSRPGANVTGVSLLASALSGKKFALLRELVPAAASIGALVNPGYAGVKAQVAEFQAAASQLGVQLVVLSAGTDDDLKAAFASVAQQHVAALVIANDLFFGSRRDQLIALAASNGVPVMHFQREFVAAGGLMSYGPSFDDGYRQGGAYVGQILKGEKPADLPVMQPTKFELVINLKTARSLGISVPPSLAAIADDVIE
jgi:putative tryptophan/tyrosine transport system substrate-binding protein